MMPLRWTEPFIKNLVLFLVAQGLLNLSLPIKLLLQLFLSLICYRDLEKKAARWNDKQLSALKSNKEKLSEELREAMKKSRKESELHTVKLQIKGKG